MSTVAELINQLATNSGVDANNEGLKALLSNAALSGQEVPSEIVSAINSNHLTIESAKNNSTLKNHFTALALGGVDSELSRLQGNYEFSPEILEAFKNEPSSYKRIGMMVEKVRELESAKQGQSKDGKDALQTEIDRLNKTILESGATHQTELQTQAQAHRGDMKNLMIKTALNGFDYSLPTSKEVSVTAAENIIFTELAKQGGMVVLDDNNNLMLKQAENPEMAFYVNNEKIDFKGFTESTLANHKLLKTIEPTPTPTPTPTPGTPPAPVNEFAAMADNDIKNLEGGQH